MRSLRVLTALSLLIAALSAKLFAQATATANGPGTEVTLGGGYSVFHIPYGQRDLGGAQGWMDAGLYWPVGVEAEARRLRQNQDLNTHADTYLIGPRYVFRPRALKPYVKVLAGLGEFNFPYNYAHGSYFVVAGGGGVDLRIRDRIYFRVLDVEYQKWPQFTFGPMSSFGISSGISIVLYRGQTWMSP
jgi:hypothetical protein